MAKTWVLDTETKGTGAHVAPLPGRGRRAERPLATVQLRRPPQPLVPAPESSEGQRRFKVVDVRAGSVAGEDLDARGLAALLAGVASPLDVRVYVSRGDAHGWRLLDLARTRSLWELAARSAASAAAAGPPGR